MYSEDCIGKHFSDNFPNQNNLKHGKASSSLFSLALDYAIRKVKEDQ
jgi:hypothetical protein